MDLSIVIVPYKCKEKLKVTLDAVFASNVDFEYEVIIVDNGSDDGTVDMVEREYVPLSLRANASERSNLNNKDEIASSSDALLLAMTHQNPVVTLIKNTNEGFAKGNNRGLAASKGVYKLLLNPDTKVSPETLQVMMDFMKSRPDVGIATCKLVKADGSLDAACRRSLPNPWNSLMRLTGISFLFPKIKLVSGYNLSHASVDQEMQIGSCVGAFMFVSPACYEKIGPLDEQFFMYGEDIDWCKRAQDAGFAVWYYPKTTTIHYKGVSSRKNVRPMLYEFHNAMWKYYKKHVANKYSFLFDWIIYIGIWSRFLLQLLKNKLRKEAYVSK